MKNRSFTQYLILALKGVFMGAADIIPGVSGGTIAFISGIYEELIHSLKSINKTAIILLAKGKLKAFFAETNFFFLIAVFSGILLSIFTLSKLVTYLLVQWPELLWAFFFGLIIASSYFIGKRVKQWHFSKILSLIISAVAAYFITVISPAQTPTDLWFIFLCGAIAICAMILPGISGSFILLLLGKYAYVYGAIGHLDFKVIIIFGLGCIVGLLLFSNVLDWLFKNHHDIAVSILTGFMIGSLNKVWPWKNVLLWGKNAHGVKIALQENSVLPSHYNGTTYFWGCIILCIFGFILIAGLEKFSAKTA